MHASNSVLLREVGLCPVMRQHASMEGGGKCSQAALWLVWGMPPAAKAHRTPTITSCPRWAILLPLGISSSSRGFTIWPQEVKWCREVASQAVAPEPQQEHSLGTHEKCQAWHSSQKPKEGSTLE